MGYTFKKWKLTENDNWVLTSLNRRLNKLESDGGTELYNSVFQNFLKVKKKQHYSRFTDKKPSTAERVIRNLRKLLKKPVFVKGNADWISELPSVNIQHQNTINHSNKMTTIQASKISNEKKVFSNLQEQRQKQRPKS